MNKKELIFDMINKFSAIFREKVERERLVIYTNELSSFEIEDIVTALNKLKFSSKFFPSLAEIYQTISPSVSVEDQASEYASKILEVARSFSSDNTKSAKLSLGHLWEIAELFGWKELTLLKYEELNTARAQLRRLCQSRTKNPNSNTGNLIDFKHNKQLSGGGL